jgi:hypothetical protein
MKTKQQLAPHTASPQNPASRAAATGWTRHFEASSVVLFAALTLGTAGAVHAQSSASSTGTAPSKTVVGPANATPTAGQATFGGGSAGTSSDAAFQRADANHDGMLSPQEAATLPAIGNRFQALDKNKDQMLSREEFEAGVKS